MLKRTIHLAARVLRRDAGYTAINVAGLSLGLACCVLIGFFIRHELQADRFHEKHDRIALFMLNDGYVRTGGAFGPALTERLPGIDTYTRLVPIKRRLIGPTATRQFYESGFYYADSTAFDVFDFSFLEGDPATALDAPQSIVLSASMARKYFPDAPALGNTVLVEGEHHFTVTGVMEDVPTTSHLDASFFASSSSIPRTEGRPLLSSFLYNPAYTYVLLAEGTTAPSLIEPIRTFILDRLGEDWHARTTPALVMLPDLYLRTEAAMPDQLRLPNAIVLVYSFAAIGALILLIAGLNYVNLATARAARRHTEIGVRKTLGAQSRQLVTQFLGEALVTAWVAALGAAVLVELAGPTFETVANRDLLPGLAGRAGAYALLLAAATAVGLLAGAYPSAVLSRFSPQRALQSSGRTGTGRFGLLRRSLIVAQFGAAAVMLIVTVVVGQQLQFIQSTDVGFNREQVVVLPLADPLPPDRLSAFQDALRSRAGVLSVSAASTPPGTVGPSGYAITAIPQSLRPEGSDVRQISQLSVGPGFANTLEMKLVEGRDLTPADADAVGTPRVLLNEAAVRLFGWDSALNTPYPIVTRWTRDGPQIEEGIVVGVVRDFNHTSLHSAIRPMQIVIRPQDLRNVLVRIDATTPSAVLDDLRAVWARLGPDRPFDYYFLSSRFDQQYAAERQSAVIQQAFTGIAVLIACIGLFGLAAYVGRQQRREIGLRKALGASPSQILLLATGRFLRPVALAYALALPVAYLLSTRWLSGFAYQTDLGPITFAGAGLVLFGIAIATVSWQSFRALRTDPARVLRLE